MTDQVRPIFIVGSPRSGTSILTWCLGQHSNILPLQETNWIGKFAMDLRSTYDLGAKKGEDSQLSTDNITLDGFYQTFGATINNLILRGKNRHNLEEVDTNFQRLRSIDDPRNRWVDGTPEYSLYIYGLLKLFPNAKFIHILRDVESVVKSLMNFSAIAGMNYTEQDAYSYWLRTVSACTQAEKALGSERIIRIRYTDFINTSRETLEYCMDFLEEYFYEDCLKPLQMKINSSNVPRDFSSHDPKTDPQLRDEAERVSREILKEVRPIYVPNLEDTQKLERDFMEYAQFVGSLDSDRLKALAALERAQHELGKLRIWAFIQQAREIIRKNLPRDAIVVVVSVDDNDLMDLDGRPVWRFIDIQHIDDNGTERLFATGMDGAVDVSWFRAGMPYVFHLYVGIDQEICLATIKISWSARAVLTMTTNLLSPSRAEKGMAIGWSTGSDAEGQVCVSENDAPERLFATGATGSADASWMQPDVMYKFYLYENGEHRLRLAVLELMRHGEALITAIPRAIPPGVEVGATTITWNTGDDSQGQVYLSEGYIDANSYPADTATAILLLESLRIRGATGLLCPRTAFEWLRHHENFRQYLNTHYRRIWDDESGIIYQLSDPLAESI